MKRLSAAGGRPSRLLWSVLLVCLGRACGVPDAAAQEVPAPDPGAEPPVRIDTISGDSVHPSACVAGNGDVLVVYSRGKRLAADMRLCRSSDGGKTWGEPLPLTPFADGTASVFPGGLNRLRDGRIVLSWSGPVDGRGRSPWFSISDDHGMTWSAPEAVPLSATTIFDCHRYGFLELSDDTWIFSLWNRAIRYDRTSGKAEPLDDVRHAGMVPMVRTADGTLVSGGTSNKRENGLRSTDGGKTWHPLYAFGFLNHGCPFDLTVLDNGWIVHTTIRYQLLADAKHCPETGFQMVISRDDGRTWDWPHAATIYDKGRAIQAPRGGWPRTVQIDRHLLGTVFFDQDAGLPGGGGLFMIRTPIAGLQGEAGSRP
jgi:hypothetical protein